jgi:lipopolysaccharide export system protein LptA
MLSLVVVTAVADDDVLLLLGFKKKSKSNVTVDSVKLSVIEADGELTLDGEFQRKLPVFPA